MKKAVLINFIVFKKAFDNVHRILLLNMLKYYGIPSKLINIIHSFYEGSRCSVKVDGQ